MGAVKERGVRVTLPDEEAGVAGQIAVADSTGAGTAILLDQPRVARVVPDGLSFRERRCGRVEISIETPRPNRPVRFQYRLEPITP